MGWLQTFFNASFLGNTGHSWIIAIAIFLGLFAIFMIFSNSFLAYLKKKSKKTKIKWDDAIIGFIDAISWQFYFFLAIYLSSLRLNISPVVSKVLDVLLVVFISYYAAQGSKRVINFFTEKQIEKGKSSETKQNNSMIKAFGTLLKMTVYVTIVLLALSNLGIEITPLIASLGIGGVAIAIALQSVLGDLFAAFAIYFDKPFQEGDFIIVGTDMGVVQKIGIKTTRIQTLQGQELVISNSELTNSRVNNYKRMKERRILFSIGVEYSTPSKKLKKINSMIKKAITSTKGTRFDRCHFKEFGDSSLKFEIVYYVTDPDYTKYMDIQQDINFKIMDAFEKEKIVFAFPTQTIHLEKD